MNGALIWARDSLSPALPQAVHFIVVVNNVNDGKTGFTYEIYFLRFNINCALFAQYEIRIETLLNYAPPPI